MPQTPDYICPACANEVLPVGEGYYCHGCQLTFPVIYGIPDFRLNSDAYLTLEDERIKAGKLAKKAETCNFNDLLDYYYSITDDVPDDLAAAYSRSMKNAPLHLANLAREIGCLANGPLLDAGCGSGSLLLALPPEKQPVIGLDIAMRWLVICRKRLIEAGVDIQLVCADISQPPFKASSFAAVTALDLLEHTRDPGNAVRSLVKLVRPGGYSMFTVPNRYTLAPHPSTRLWGIGYLPKKMAGRFCRIIRGVDSLRYTHLITPGQIARLLKQAGCLISRIRPKQVVQLANCPPPVLEGFLITVYRLLCRWSLTSKLLVWVGPVTEIMAVKSDFKEN